MERAAGNGSGSSLSMKRGLDPLTHVNLCLAERGTVARTGARDGPGQAPDPRQPLTTGIFPILARHSAGPALCTALPAESTATVTGMSLTSNS
jgi:hypothetical protein